MKYFLLGLAVVCFAFSAIRFLTKKPEDGDRPKDKKNTTIRLSKNLVDVGQQKLHGDVKAGYVIYNTGQNDLTIQNVAPDCHCTVAAFSKLPIAPGDSSIITLAYDAAQPGPFQSSAVVSTNTQESNTILVLRGSIKE